MTATAGWLLAYQTHGNSTSSSFDVASVMGNISCAALSAANAASAVNFLKDLLGGCKRFVKRGAEATIQLKSSKDKE